MSLLGFFFVTCVQKDVRCRSGVEETPDHVYDNPTDKMSLSDSQRMLLTTGPTTEAQFLAMMERERALPMPPAVPSPAYECYRQIYPNFDAQLSRCEGNCDLAIGLLAGLMNESEVDAVLNFRRSRSDGGRAADVPLPAAGAAADAAAYVVSPAPDAAAAAPNVPPPAVAAPPPLAPAVDPNCPGLQMARDNGDARELDVVSMTSEHLWQLFMNPNVNGGYLGKSVIQVWVQGF
jgi:hypothetical protein